GVEPGAGETELRPVEPYRKAEDVDVEGQCCVYVIDIDRDMVDAERFHAAIMALQPAQPPLRTTGPDARPRAGSAIALTLLLGGAADRVHRTANVVLVCRPVADRDPQHVPVLPTRPRHPRFAVSDQPRGYGPGSLVVFERHTNLRELDVVQDL